MLNISQNYADICLKKAEDLANELAKNYGIEKDVKFYLGTNQNLLTFRREIHRDENSRPLTHVVDISNENWIEDISKYITQEFKTFKILDDRRKAYDPENKIASPCIEPRWSFDIHPITMALINICETKRKKPKTDRRQSLKDEPFFNKMQRLNGGFGRLIRYDINPNLPIKSLSIFYGGGIIRLDEAIFKNGMIPEHYPESVLASFKGSKAETLIDIFANVRGMNKIKILSAHQEEKGTIFKFTNFLVPWELSNYDKASWRKTNLKNVITF